MNTTNDVALKQEYINIPAMFFINNFTGDDSTPVGIRQERRIINKARRAIDRWGTKNAVLKCLVTIGEDKYNNKIEDIVGIGCEKDAYL